MSSPRGTSPWTWIGCGCGALLLVFVATIAIVVFLGWRTAKNFEAGFTDPEGRALVVERILKPHSIPDGYYAVGGMTIPFFIELAILSDREPTFEEGDNDLGERAFIYVTAPGFLADSSGDGDELDFLKSGNVRVNSGESIDEGELELDDMRVSWVAFRGEVDVESETREGITSLLRINCTVPPDSRVRFAVWITPDPTLTNVEADLTGTPADEAAIAAMMRHFAICAAS